MNFLQLAQDLRLKCGVSGSGPASVAGQTGESARLVNWIANAWLEIQSLHQDWEFLRKSVSFVTQTGLATYSPLLCGAVDASNALDFGMWARETFRNYNTTAGFNSETLMYWIPYAEWRDTYQFGANRSVNSRPVFFTVTPNKSLGLGPVPLAGYTVVGDYYSKPVALVADTDIPAMPDKYHQMIVSRAMMAYGAYEGATEVYQRGEMLYNQLLSELVIDQLPHIEFAGALA